MIHSLGDHIPLQTGEPSTSMLVPGRVHQSFACCQHSGDVVQILVEAICSRELLKKLSSEWCSDPSPSHSGRLRNAPKTIKHIVDCGLSSILIHVSSGVKLSGQICPRLTIHQVNGKHERVGLLG